MKAKPTSEILNFLTPYAESLGLEIVEVVFKMSKNPQLTVFIDKEGGVDLNSCEAFHNLISDPLDVLDPYPAPYTLNVSSPGLDRPLKTERDFLKRIGKLVEIKLYAPMQGKKYLEAVLKGYDGNNVTVELDGKDIKIPMPKIAKINEAIIFD
ncbi:MAG: ribosome maturation factor RimP [Clostridia bacterium]|nr:ribosome maturation factor RimP [Clostridia bacterium]